MGSSLVQRAGARCLRGFALFNAHLIALDAFTGNAAWIIHAGLPWRLLARMGPFVSAVCMIKRGLMSHTNHMLSTGNCRTLPGRGPAPPRYIEFLRYLAEAFAPSLENCKARQIHHR